MKTAISFICGVVVCALIIIGVKPILPALADTSDNGEASSNETNFLADLIPDFEKIYRESLTSPFIRAGANITDPDIAGYYNDLMSKTGLTDPNRN
jgi:hypothetical protein